MRILLLGNSLTDTQQSMLRFADLLESGLTDLHHEVRLIKPKCVLGRLAWSEASAKWFGYVDKIIVFPWLLGSHLQWAQVVHICDHSNAFYTRYLRSKPHIVTCHDMIAVRSALGLATKHHTRWSGRLLQRLILTGLVRAQHVVCVSEATRSDLQSIACLPAACVSVTYNGLNYPYSPMPADEASDRLRLLGVNPTLPYLLHVGGNQWYKNRAGVMKIYSELRKLPGMSDLRLVMAGKSWTSELRGIIKGEHLGAAVLELTGNSSEDLRALYSLASLLLFPSFAEGFGWPIVEAQACGCRVATSNRSPMTEIAGPAAIYVDPENPRSAAATIAEALGNFTDDRQPPLMNAARFSASKMIDSYVAHYSLVMQSANTLEHSGAPRRTTNAPQHQ